MLAAENTSNQRSSTTSQNENRVTAEICKLYLQKKCPKGKSGRVNGVCPNKHPDICFKYLRGGTKQDGCNRGASCRFYHPKICYQFARKGKCSRPDCTFYHAKERLRKSPGSAAAVLRGQEVRAEEARRRDGAVNQRSYARVAGRTAGVRSNARPETFQSPSSSGLLNTTVAPQQNQTSDFLGMQTQMQEQIRQLSQMMQVLVSRDSYIANPIRQTACRCTNRS